MRPRSRFTRFAHETARISGHPTIFALATLTIVVWALTGPAFHYSNTWQLVINTGTTIVTFLMVFLIQNTQNRDSQALQIKLDEIIRSLDAANNALLDLEDLEEKDLDIIRKDYERLAEEARTRLKAHDPRSAARVPGA
ncbi:MAG TPA: low affinity iron permease family protein [Gemmatimonadales bacterium]|jgi:low affinity Fe/Cu permease|nr:low affinity iron permease family protein [Gemmatimonadales bacterium]